MSESEDQNPGSDAELELSSYQARHREERGRLLDERAKAGIIAGPNLWSPHLQALEMEMLRIKAERASGKKFDPYRIA